MTHLPAPTPGEELVIGPAASVQSARQPGFVIRVTSVCPQPTYPGWVWLTGYQLDGQGHAGGCPAGDLRPARRPAPCSSL